MTLVDQINEAASLIRTKTKMAPEIGIILGTGLGKLGEKITVETTISYEQIPHFAVSTVEGHAGRLIFGMLSGKKVVAMQGRFHFYEGYSMEQVTFPVRAMKALGIKVLIVCNATGGLNPQFKKGDMVLITDHINFTGQNPLLGHNDDKLGPRFPDMYNCYDKDLLNLAEETALKLGYKVNRGVYVGVTGPNLETAAEYRMLRTMGGDQVGMSTVPEVIVARHQGTKVLGVSIITDMGLPDHLEPCSHEKILASADMAEPKMTELIAAVIERMQP
jgi:purine-nucleoside phosphorylase